MRERVLERRLELTYEPVGNRRIIAGKDVIIHCHHYNSRIQRTVESATAIDGKAILVSTAEAVFGEQIRDLLREESGAEERRLATEALYAHLGYGRIDLGTIDRGIISAPHSHFVEGWLAGYPERNEPVCSLTEGYLQAAILAITGRTVAVREVECAVGGAPVCRFEIDPRRTEPAAENVKIATVEHQACRGERLTSRNVDEALIVDTLVQMPIHGNDDGLIPAFNVYLANTPADFYNLLCLRFVEEMEREGLGEAARTQLIHDAETCGLNTFRGIMESPEWDALVAPMLIDPEDTMFGLIAVSNALGWGNWQIREYTCDERLQLATTTGYEATGCLEYRGRVAEPACLMLTGVSAGLMELVHCEGSIHERFGQYSSCESACRACGSGECVSEVEEVA